jgi:hypothetical protein
MFSPSNFEDQFFSQIQILVVSDVIEKSSQDLIKLLFQIDSLRSTLNFEENFEEKNLCFFFDFRSCIRFDVILLFFQNENFVLENFLSMNGENLISTFNNTPIKFLVPYIGNKLNKLTYPNCESIILLSSDLSKFGLIKQITEKFSQEINFLKNKFNECDEDKKGLIEINDLPLLMTSLNTTDYSISIGSLQRLFGNQISFNEFYFWWIYRKCDNLLDIFSNIKFCVDLFFRSNFYFNNFKRGIKSRQGQEIKFEFKNINLERIIYDYIFDGNISLGSINSKYAAKNYLSKFSDDLSYSETDFISLGIFSKLEIDEKDHNKTSDNIEEALILSIESILTKEYLHLFRNLITFDRQINSNTTNVILKLKNEADFLLKIIFKDFIFVKNWILNSQLDNMESEVFLEFKIISIMNDIKKNINSTQNKFKINFQGYYDSMKFSTILKNIHPKTLENYEEELLLPIMKIIEKISQDIKTKTDTLHNISRIELGFNIFGVFLNLQFSNFHHNNQFI